MLAELELKNRTGIRKLEFKEDLTPTALRDVGTLEGLQNVRCKRERERVGEG